jgi:branched-chain amino acid transport system substrate-binding protein
MTLNRRQILAGAALIGVARPHISWAAKDPVRIGVPTALTGPYADLGNQVKRAVDFAVEAANVAGGVDGRQVEVRYLDTEAKADLARQQGEKLALSGYNLLMSTIASGEGLAIGPQLVRWNALYIATINKADDITGKACSPRMFRVNHPDSSDSAVVQPWLKQQKQKKWAIQAGDTAWGHNSGASFSKAAQADGRTIVSESYSPFGTNDYAPYIQKIADSGAEGLWVALAGRDAITFAQQARQFGLFDKVLTAGVSFIADNQVKTLGSAAKGILGIINYGATLDTPENRQFVAAWQKKYPGTTPTNFEGETYLGTQVLFQAVKKAGSVASANVARAMEGTTFSTIYGNALMRREDHQLVTPNYFGYVGEVDGVMKPIITMTVPADVVFPAPAGSCKLVG